MEGFIFIGKGTRELGYLGHHIYLSTGPFVTFPEIIWIRRYGPCSCSGRDFCGEADHF